MHTGLFNNPVANYQDIAREIWRRRETEKKTKNATSPQSLTAAIVAIATAIKFEGKHHTEESKPSLSRSVSSHTRLLFKKGGSFAAAAISTYLIVVPNTLSTRALSVA